MNSRIGQRVKRYCAVLAALLVSTAPVWAVPSLPAEVMINEVEFVLIPAGWFYKSGGVPSRAPHGESDSGGSVRIWMDDYYIAKYEARARDLERFMNASNGELAAAYGGENMGCALRRDANGKYYEVNPNHHLPATHVSWILADEWSRWMGFRLLSESEWEKAARGTDQRLYPWGNEEPDETFANFGTTSDCLVWPVNTSEKGKSPYGVYHMAGNVREITAEAHNPEADKRFVEGARNPHAMTQGVTSPGEKHSLKLIKGGRWASLGLELQIPTRIPSPPDDPFQCNGTRFALDADKVREHLVKGSATVLRP